MHFLPLRELDDNSPIDLFVFAKNALSGGHYGGIGTELASFLTVLESLFLEPHARAKRCNFEDRPVRRRKALRRGA